MLVEELLPLLLPELLPLLDEEDPLELTLELPAPPDVLPSEAMSVHLAVRVMFEVTKVEKLYSAPPISHPLKVYPLLVGSAGFVTDFPLFSVTDATALPPAESKVTVTGTLLAYTSEYVEKYLV